MNEDVLVYDIESKTQGKPDPMKDKMILFGCYSYKTNKFYTLSNKEDIQKIINGHKFLIGFNNYDYDNVILKREGFSLDYKIIIDLMAIIKKRASIIKIEKGLLSDLLVRHSLDFITKTLGLVSEEDGKMKFDYTLMNKLSWTAEERKTIRDYTIRDIEVTKKLYEWLDDYFSVFKHFIDNIDVEKKAYLTSSTAKLTYKIICKALKWTEEYNIDVIENEDDEKIGGGYVSYPAGEFFDNKNGPIFYKDFRSLYPHIMAMCNIHSRNIGNDDYGWKGGGVWKVEGIYNSKELGELATFIKTMYHQRLEFKRMKDKREYVVKILLNSMYGITDKEYYKLVFDKIAAGDCTRIGRQWIKYTRKKFHEAGYKVIYSDTDSTMVQDTFNDRERFEKVEKEIVDYIKSTVPFPQDTFSMGLEDEIKYFYFFKGKVDKEEDEEMDELDKIYKPKQLLKKNYIYVNTKDKITIKNLGLRKKSNSELSRKIFNEQIVPQAIKGNIKFSKTWMLQTIKDELRKDIMLGAIRKDVGSLDEYSKSLTGLQAQISKKYGSGIYFMLPNIKNIGVGKGCSYCTIEEYKENKLCVEDLNLDYYMSELSYFVREVPQRDVFSFEVKV